MSVEFTIEGLNAKQRALADIMWGLEEFDAVEAFIGTLPKREQRECKTIIELMKMAVIEQCYDGITELDLANKVIDKFRK
jgi:hypothetical protein